MVFGSNQVQNTRVRNPTTQKGKHNKTMGMTAKRAKMVAVATNRARILNIRELEKGIDIGGDFSFLLGLEGPKQRQKRQQTKR